METVSFSVMFMAVAHVSRWPLGPEFDVEAGAGTGALSGVVGLAGENSDHVCALLNDGSAECWGRNIEQQLGDGTNIDNAILDNDSADEEPHGSFRVETGIASAEIPILCDCELYAGGNCRERVNSCATIQGSE
jgi:alpha-tubulin suppressor-like RCC1 family protein